MYRLAVAITTLLLCNRSVALLLWLLNSSLPFENLAIFFALLIGALVLLYATVLQESSFWQEYVNHLNLYGPAALAGIGLSFWP